MAVSQSAKDKGCFPTDQILIKMLYLAADKIQKKWTQRYRNWDMVISQISILFDIDAA